MSTDPQFPPRDLLFALIASIPGSGTFDWCTPARALLDEIEAPAPVSPPPATDRAALSAADRQLLTFALDLAADQMTSRGDEFDADDEDAMERLRRLAAGERDEQQAQDGRCPHGCDTSTCPCLACEDDEERQPDTEPEPREETGAALARHLADQQMMTIQGAFQILGWAPLRFKLVDDATPVAASTPRANENDGTVAETGGTLRRAHVALAEQAGRAHVALARVRQLHDRLAEETDLTSPDDSITRGAAAKRIATALDGWSPELRPARGDQFETWLKTQRGDWLATTSQWHVLDAALDLYRLHADTGTPLDEHVCEGKAVGDCDCLEPAAAPVAGQPPADTGEEAREEIECANCWRVVENRSVPNMGSLSRDNWVHIPGGFQSCFPQRGADSPRAEPELTVVPQPETVHGCPPDGSGLTPCCGRTPFELPLTDRISSEVPVTCKGADRG